jgi:hypothetical protein
VEHSDGRGLIEYTTEDAEAFIGFREVKQDDNVVSFWKGGFYQAALNTETNRLYYGNDEVDFSIKVAQEFVDEVQSEVGKQ